MHLEALEVNNLRSLQEAAFLVVNSRHRRLVRSNLRAQAVLVVASWELKIQLRLHSVKLHQWVQILSVVVNQPNKAAFSVAAVAQLWAWASRVKDSEASEVVASEAIHLGAFWVNNPKVSVG